MKYLSWITLCCVFLSAEAFCQDLKEREETFLDAPPRVGEKLPDVEVYDTDGKPFSTAQMRGHYTVLTFGCLTCPPSMWNIAGLEAVQRDYGPRGVKFYFIYKSLAHPELAGNYIQPYTQDERLRQAQQAVKQFGTQIPWIVDAMDNRLKHALGDRPNSQFLIDPQGTIVRKRAWSNPLQVRQDLETVIGPVERVTRVEDLDLKLQPAITGAAPRDLLPRIPRDKMQPLVVQPLLESSSAPYYAKLRAEAEASLLDRGTGKLYLGFQLDPFYPASWNNLVEPLKVELEIDSAVQMPRTLEARQPAQAHDASPREFLVDVAQWRERDELLLKVRYAICIGQETCQWIEQQYRVRRVRDTDGGGARGAGAGLWETEEFTRRLLMADVNKDRKLGRAEAVGLLLPHFDKLDTNRDDLLDTDELAIVTSWLNEHHQPGTP